MLDPRAHDSTMAAPPSTADAIRAVSNRLAARASIWEGPKATPSWPAWPHSLVGEPRLAGIGSESKPATASTNAVELNRSVLDRPSLAASDPSSDAAKTPEVSPTEAGPGATRAINSQPAVPASDQAGQASSLVPSAAIPVVPGTAHGFGGLGGELANNPASSSTTNSSASGPIEPQSSSGPDGGASSPMPQGTTPVSSIAGSSSGRTNINPSVGGGSTALNHGVRGRMPAAMSSLAMASPGTPNGPLPGSRDESPFAAAGGDISGFTSMGSNNSGDGGATDLSKTNELLQQIVDAVRKQQSGGGTPLPAGGPSVYAERI